MCIHCGMGAHDGVVLDPDAVDCVKNKLVPEGVREGLYVVNMEEGDEVIKGMDRKWYVKPYKEVADVFPEGLYRGA
jgi:hypothetical protein